MTLLTGLIEAVAYIIGQVVESGVAKQCLESTLKRHPDQVKAAQSRYEAQVKYYFQQHIKQVEINQLIKLPPISLNWFVVHHWKKGWARKRVELAVEQIWQDQTGQQWRVWYQSAETGLGRPTLLVRPVITDSHIS